jgi:hypothetical protein
MKGTLMIRKIRDIISMLIFLRALYTALLGFKDLAKDCVEEVRYQLQRRRNPDTTRFDRK